MTTTALRSGEAVHSTEVRITGIGGLWSIRDVSRGRDDVVHLDPEEREHLRQMLNAEAIAAVEAVPAPSRIGRTVKVSELRDGEYYQHVESRRCTFQASHRGAHHRPSLGEYGAVEPGEDWCGHSWGDDSVVIVAPPVTK
jgi:hypothetical protein